MNKLKPNNRTVLITGATSGIGSAIAFRFAKEGWSILGHYFSSDEKAEKLKKIIKDLNVDCYLIKADLSKISDVNHVIAESLNHSIGSLINNAGTYVVSKHFNKLTIDDITKTFMVNTFAPMLLSPHIFAQMKERGFGRIINISSIAAKYGGSSYSMHYGCSKLAMEGLTKTLAKEGAEHNILVNTIRPGVIDTDFHRKFSKDMTKRIKMISVGRMGTPNDIACMAYYLGSDDNKFITNEIITVAGGE